MEDNDIGRLLRDAMVEKIWEGTINVEGDGSYRGESTEYRGVVIASM